MMLLMKFLIFRIIFTNKLRKLKDNFSHFLTPKIFIRYAPGSMRQEDDGDRLIIDDAFDMNRILNK